MISNEESFKFGEQRFHDHSHSLLVFDELIYFELINSTIKSFVNDSLLFPGSKTIEALLTQSEWLSLLDLLYIVKEICFASRPWRWLFVVVLK